MRSKARPILGYLLATLLAAAGLMAQAARPGAYPLPGYVYVWGDDFNGSALDPSKWMYRTDVKAESSQRPGNVRVENGALVIEMEKQADRGKQYTGGGVISKQRFRYGYYEARVKMFGGSGWHESVWAMFALDGSTTYPAQMRTEIDGMEFDSATPERGHMGLIIWRRPGESRHLSCTPGAYQGALDFDATQGFHTYGFEWTAANVKYYLDGKQRCVLDYPPSAGEHDRINFWLTAIGYERGGKIDDAKLPGRMLVDFAAFYRKEGKQ
jgi:beta-glucanase (GH16 family)